MLNWPALAVALAGVPLLLLASWCLGRNPAVAPTLAVEGTASRKRFVHTSMLLALLASFAVGTFEVGLNLFGSQTLGLTTATMAAMFITCGLAMLAAQSMVWDQAGVRSEAFPAHAAVTCDAYGDREREPLVVCFEEELLRLQLAGCRYPRATAWPHTAWAAAQEQWLGPRQAADLTIAPEQWLWRPATRFVEAHQGARFAGA